MSNPNLTQEQIVAMQAEIAALQAENNKLKGRKTDNGLKVTEKGAVSFYMGTRFPVTLYRDQWEALIGNVENIKAFIEANKAKLPSRKELAKVEEAA